MTRLVFPLATVMGISGAIAQIGQAVQVNGTVYFEQVPRLVEAITTRNQAGTWGGMYYFTLDVPNNAGEPLQQVTFAQENGQHHLQFNTDDSRAFEGTRRQRGDELSLGAVTVDSEARTVSVQFDPPVPPGKTITVGLRPRRNPRFGGVYLWGVTAFPAGEQVHGQFLGFGRLHFYESDPLLSSRRFWR